MKGSFKDEAKINNSSSSDLLNSVKNKLDLEQKELLNQYESSFIQSNTQGIPLRYNYIEYNKPYVMDTDHNEEFKMIKNNNYKKILIIILLILIFIMIKY